jgi:hypothetical protein
MALFSFREPDFWLSWELLIGKVRNEVVGISRKNCIQVVRKGEGTEARTKVLAFVHQHGAL